MASWFKSKGRDTEPEPEREESTIEVRARVIAEAAGGPVPEQPEEPLVDEFTAAPVTGVAPEIYDQAVEERRSMVALCLYAHDRARSSGVAERIEEGLAAVGVTALRPDGERFDPAVHEAGGTVGTDDAELDGTVAETEVVGFSDRGQVLRPPIVTVYTRRADR